MEEKIVTNIELKPVMRHDIETVWKMQVEAFSELLEKYLDYVTSPATESADRVLARFEQPWTMYYFILADEERVGVICIGQFRWNGRHR